jgi:hypothetical protein
MSALLSQLQLANVDTASEVATKAENMRSQAEQFRKVRRLCECVCVCVCVCV